MKCRPVIAPDGHAATHVPHALQTAPITRLRFAAGSNSIAEYGQTDPHTRQPLHRASSTSANTASTSIRPRLIRARIRAAAARACATLSGISFGDWHAPAM